jgi:hypothetical protein
VHRDEAQIPPGSDGGSTVLTRLRRAAGAASSIVWVRAGASASRRAIAAVSGRLRQYLFGISARVAATFARAGLNMAR